LIYLLFILLIFRAVSGGYSRQPGAVAAAGQAGCLPSSLPGPGNSTYFQKSVSPFLRNFRTEICENCEIFFKSKNGSLF
jgi:hypothetical protein